MSFSILPSASICGWLSAFATCVSNSRDYTPPPPSSSLPGSFPGAPVHRPLPQPPKPANKTILYKFGGQEHEVIVAGKCRHLIHPAYTKTYASLRCPKCTMSSLIENLAEKIAAVEWWPQGAYFRKADVALWDDGD
ncbi:hypothetical protein K491DRAFT_709822 [Lophiostoma macrostomum CBS 122681]|uniref:Uncharacterized protein n=1 Tax=Lophiostoma macrostomum CBS 122681 TaxID=1314788 RepID=A0A6A6TU70_9PLEO|nr:hypothetical protein K491DRAFT_709822 [Lophiostoma macrostomum CBS 122681]